MTDEAHGQSTRAFQCPHDLGFDNEIGPLGCRLVGHEMECVCEAMHATRPSLPAPGREEMIALADRIEATSVVSVMEQPKKPGPIWAMPLSDENQAAIVSALRFAALSRPPENVDHRATEPVPRAGEAVAFDPTNHHNALKCPYCNPQGLKFAHPMERGALEEVREALQSVVDVSKSGADTVSFLVELNRVARLCAAALSPSSTAGDSDKRITGASDIVDEAACLIWAELCPGMVMGDADRPYYENAAKAVLALPRTPGNGDSARLRSAGRSDKPILPRELTAENGAKAALLGEFHEDYTWFDECGDEHPGRVTVSWTTIKAIWKAAVAHFDKNPPHIPVECFTLGPKIAVADSVPGPWKVVLAWVSDPAVAIHNKMCIAWRDDSKQKAWWSGLPQSYIRLEAERWNVTHWAEIGAPQSPAGSESTEAGRG